MTCDDLGPDLLALVLDPTVPDAGDSAADAASAAVRAHVAGCDRCTAELARLREACTTAIAAAIAAERQLEPSPGALFRLLLAVEDEAAERRLANLDARAREAAAAGAPALPCNGRGEDLTALALDQLEPAARVETEEHAAACQPCGRDLLATRALLSAARVAPDLEPAADGAAGLLVATRGLAQEPPEGSEDRLRGVPSPARPRRRGRPWVQVVLVPAAAAAAFVIALTLGSRDPQGALVETGDAMHLPGVGEEARQLGGSERRFTFAVGDRLEAGPADFAATVPLLPGADPAARGVDGDPPAGVVRVVLAPGARLTRTGMATFELVAGRVELAAGPMDPPLTVRSGPFHAVARGTRFTVTVADGRLVAVVERGSVEIGRGVGPAPRTALVEAGRQGLVNLERILVEEADGRRAGEVFLAPRPTLRGPREPVRAGDGGTARFRATLRVGLGGPVDIAPFDDALPLFQVRLEGPHGRSFTVKIQRSMLRAVPAGDPGAAGSPGYWRLTAEAPYRIGFDLPVTDLEPGRWNARLRYMSYRAESLGAEWLGVVESPPVEFEVEKR